MVTVKRGPADLATDARQGDLNECSSRLISAAEPVQFGFAVGRQWLFATSDYRQTISGVVDDRLTTVTLLKDHMVRRRVGVRPDGTFVVQLPLNMTVNRIDFTGGGDFAVRCDPISVNDLTPAPFPECHPI